MTTPRSISTNYGGPYEDEFVVENPTTEQSSAFANRALEDLAQLTNTTIKAWCRFPTIAAAAPQVPVATHGRSHMGAGSGELPTVAKTGVGAYTLTYDSTWTDALTEVETVSFTWSRGSVRSLTVCGVVQTTESGPVITVQVFDMAGAAVDLTDGTVLLVEAG